MNPELTPLMTTGHPALPQTIVVFSTDAVSVGFEIPAFGRSLLVSGSFPREENDPTGQIALAYALAEAMTIAAGQLRAAAAYEVARMEEDEEEAWNLDLEDEDDELDWGASPAFDVIAPYLTGRALNGVGSWMPKLTLGQIDVMTDEELLERPGVGEATLHQIRQAIFDHSHA